MVPTHHLPSPHSSAPLEKLQPNKKLKARLLWVDVAVKKVGLTLRPQLVEGRSYEFEGIEIGDVYEGEGGRVGGGEIEREREREGGRERGEREIIQLPPISYSCYCATH